MRKIVLFSFSILYWSNAIYSQPVDFFITFEDSTITSSYLAIDTLTHSSNSWQIGIPQKTLFNAAFSGDYAIITDTLNNYSVNDTSVFVVSRIYPEVNGGYSPTLSGYYKVNSDSLTDFGKIEFSLNSSIWVDLLSDTTFDEYVYHSNPILTGNSEWEYFEIDIAPLYSLFGGNSGNQDTIHYRFTFISDSVENNKDGLMFDELAFLGNVESIDEYTQHSSLDISPNPVTTKFQVKTNYLWENYEIYSTIGEIVQTGTKGLENNIDVSSLREGIYLISIIDKNQRVGTGRFMKE